MTVVFLFLIYFTLYDRLGSSILTHVFGIYKNATDEPIYRAGIEMQIGRTDLGTRWGKERVGWIGRLGLTYTQYHRVRLFVTPWTVAHRFLCPWNSPGKNTGAGSHSFLQGIFPTQRLNPGLLHCKQILYPSKPSGKPVK